MVIKKLEIKCYIEGSGQNSEMPKRVTYYLFE